MTARLAVGTGSSFPPGVSARPDLCPGFARTVGKGAAESVALSWPAVLTQHVRTDVWSGQGLLLGGSELRKDGLAVLSKPGWSGRGEQVRRRLGLEPPM